MPTMQIRDVPAEVSRVLKVRAAASGRSLSEYLLDEVTRLAERPTLADLTAALAKDAPRGDLRPASETIAAERTRRD